MAVQGCGPYVGQVPIFGRGQRPALSPQQVAYIDEAIKEYGTIVGTLKRIKRVRETEASIRRKGWKA